MPNTWHIEIDDQQVRAAFKRLQAEGQNAQATLQEVGDELVSEVRLGFSEGRDPWGGPWEGLKLRDGQPLRDTDRLMNSIAAVARGNDLEIGTNVFYGPVHQFGAEILPRNKPRLVFKPRGGRWYSLGRVTVPDRPFLPIRNGRADLPQQWVDSVTDIIKSSIEGAWDD